jgi:hypothetical protein
MEQDPAGGSEVQIGPVKIGQGPAKLHPADFFRFL